MTINSWYRRLDYGDKCWGHILRIFASCDKRRRIQAAQKGEKKKQFNEVIPRESSSA